VIEHINKAEIFVCHRCPS